MGFKTFLSDIFLEIFYMTLDVIVLKKIQKN
jgi:hypothetical protein